MRNNKFNVLLDLTLVEMIELQQWCNADLFVRIEKLHDCNIWWSPFNDPTFTNTHALWHVPASSAGLTCTIFQIHYSVNAASKQAIVNTNESFTLYQICALNLFLHRKTSTLFLLFLCYIMYQFDTKRLLSLFCWYKINQQHFNKVFLKAMAVCVCVCVMFYYTKHLSTTLKTLFTIMVKEAVHCLRTQQQSAPARIKKTTSLDSLTNTGFSCASIT